MLALYFWLEELALVQDLFGRFYHREHRIAGKINNKQWREKCLLTRSVVAILLESPVLGQVLAFFLPCCGPIKT